MPGLFAVAIHPALVAAHDDLRSGEDLYAFLDDTYVSCERDRACVAFSTLRAALKRHANIDVRLGKTRVWNAAGVETPGLRESRRRHTVSWCWERRGAATSAKERPCARNPRPAGPPICLAPVSDVRRAPQ